MPEKWWNAKTYLPSIFLLNLKSDNKDDRYSLLASTPYFNNYADGVITRRPTSRRKKSFKFSQFLIEKLRTWPHDSDTALL